MSLPATPAIVASESIASFRDAEHTALVARLTDGSVFGWPLHLLTAWSLRHSSDSGTQELNIAIGDTNLRVQGERLAEIIAELAACQRGIELHAHETRYGPLADKRRPFIFSIEVEEQLPAENEE